MISRPRAALLWAASVLAVVAAPLTATAAPSSPSAPRGFDDLGRLREDSPVAVHVDRDDNGAVALVRSSSGRPMVAPSTPDAGPRRTARSYLDRYGDLLDLDGRTSVAGTLHTRRSAGGGHVARATQEVGGVPVFAGEVVLTLDPEDRLLSLGGETTEPTTVPVPLVSEARARRTAVAVAAAAHGSSISRLTTVSAGRWLYDPQLVGEPTTGGVRPVWRFEVTGPGVRDLVLVDTGRGGVALRVDELTGLTRRVCDRRNEATTFSVPACTSARAVRGETTGVTGQPEVDAAFENIGRASDFYAGVGRNLGETIGVGTTGSKAIEAWARWCTLDEEHPEPCPMHNAFWDGARMVFGDGYAGADDVVAHELTHGVIDRTSQLVYLHQSGAINESMADVMGELVDQRNHEVGEDDSAWLMGEDLPDGALRSMANPPRFGQPDRMTSAAYGADDINKDSGDVHLNSGVGNKTAYLIAHGIAGDPSHTKTATLYHEVIGRLTSGAEYDDLGRTLIATCDELATSGAAGFDADDCTAVRSAVSATELMRQPAVTGSAAPEVSDACPTGQVKVTLFHDDDGAGTSWTRVGQGYDGSGALTWLWTRAPETFGAPRYVNSGAWSWYGAEPDPENYGDPATVTLWPTNAITLPTQGRTYLHFHHAHVLEWYPATATAAAAYRDGAAVEMYTRSGTGWARNGTALTWVNGPDKSIRFSPTATAWRGFGGDSHGWGSSRVDLTPLAGKAVRPQWKVRANQSISYLGWYVDDIELYNCRSAVPTAARSVTATGTSTGARLTWTAPEWAGSGIGAYQVTSSDGLVRSLPASARATTYTTLPAGPTTTFKVAPVNVSGVAGPAVSRKVVRTRLSTSVSSTRVPKNSDVLVSARLARTDVTGYVAGQPVVFQRRPAGSTTWSTLATRTTGTDGTVSARIVVPSTAYLRVVYRGGVGWVGSVGPERAVTAY
jgi:bacillolysin